MSRKNLNTLQIKNVESTESKGPLSENIKDIKDLIAPAGIDASSTNHLEIFSNTNKYARTMIISVLPRMCTFPEFLKNLEDYNLENSRILLAISGGKDSMTMLDLFNCFKDELKLDLVACHFNHSLREDADRDEKCVKSQCEKYGLKFYSKKEDVLLYSNENKLSTEEGARFLRYKFFDEIKRAENIEYIATAHNKKDGERFEFRRRSRRLSYSQRSRRARHVI